MTSKYVPPHKRNQTNLPPPPSGNLERQVAVCVPPDNDFVPLVSSVSKMSSGSSMSWKSVKFENIHDTNLPTPTASTKKNISVRKTTPNPITEIFYDSDSEANSDIEEVHHPEPLNSDGWTLVEKKVKPKRDKIQEAIDNGDAQLSDQEEEDSYWDEQPEEYETYWDRKP
jgi:hypothetical protein